MSTLDSLRRRRSGRALLAIARRVRGWLRATSSHPATRRIASRTALALRALPALPQRRARAAALEAALATLPAAPDSTRPIVTVAIDGHGARLPPRVAPGELVAFVASTSEPLGDAVARLAAHVDTGMPEGIAAAGPLLVHPRRPLRLATPDDLHVRALGLKLTEVDGAPVPVARLHGAPVADARDDTDVDALSLVCAVIDRDAYEAVATTVAAADLIADEPDAAGVALCRALRATGARVVAVHDAVVVDHRRVDSITSLSSPVDVTGSAWRHVVDDHGAALLRDARGSQHVPLRVAFTVAVPSRKVAPRWGDWHLAHAFARALRALGHEVLVQTLDRADDPATRACDVHVVMRGLARVRRTRGQRHVLWVISHPETVGAAECDEADLVLVASERFATTLRQRTSTPVEVMLQATDPHRFHRVVADPRHSHAVAVVAKTRDVARPIVLDALAAGLRPAIYGSGWESFVDPELVVAQYVPNEDLPTVYSSVGVLLNDHWDTMRAHGFVSNRLFDALACATPVVSDDLPEIQTLFDGAVATARDPDELRAQVDAALRDPDAARARAERGREVVLGSHTFDHRARELLAALARHGLDRVPA